MAPNRGPRAPVCRLHGVSSRSRGAMCSFKTRSKGPRCSAGLHWTQRNNCKPDVRGNSIGVTPLGEAVGWETRRFEDDASQLVLSYEAGVDSRVSMVSLFERREAYFSPIGLFDNHSCDFASAVGSQTTYATISGLFR